MKKVDVAIIEALTKALNRSIQQHMASLGSDTENINLFKMNFIKKFTDDVMFLNDLSGNKNFYHRYGYLIMRNMLEQLIEFLYVKKKPCLVDEYLGLKIDLNVLQDKHSPVEDERTFGKKRYLENRPHISEMAKDIGELKAAEGALSLYDVYCILSEKCHNSYFDSLLNDFNSAGFGVPIIGLADEHMTLLYAMTAVVLAEY